MKRGGKFLGDEVFDAAGLSRELGWVPLLHWHGELLLKLCYNLGHHGDPSQVLDLGGLDLDLRWRGCRR